MLLEVERNRKLQREIGEMHKQLEKLERRKVVLQNVLVSGKLQSKNQQAYEQKLSRVSGIYLRHRIFENQ